MPRHARFNPVLPVTGLVVCVLLFVGCGAEGSLLSGKIAINPVAPVAYPLFTTQLPPPSALHATSYTPQDLLHRGSEYGALLPQQRVTRAGDLGWFTPDWQAPDCLYAGLAFATYQFQLDGFDLSPSLHFTWEQTGLPADGWVAYADFTRDRWDWFPLPESSWIQFDPAIHISPSGRMYVFVLFTGTAEWKLQKLQIGAENRGDWWMMGRNPGHTRRSSSTGPATNARRWSYSTSGWIWSSPAIGADGTVYVGGYDYGVYAINPDGSPKWIYATGGYVVSSPAIGADGTVYCGSCDHKCYAINPDGSLQWIYTTGNAICSSPAVSMDGTLYVGSDDGKLYAINFDGRLKWSYDTQIQLRCSPAIGMDGTVFVSSDDGKLYAINPDGNLKWMTDGGGPEYASPAVGADGTVYVRNNQKLLYAINPDGTLKWTYSIDNYDRTSSPAIGIDGTIYIGSCDFKLYAINPDGTSRWKFVAASYINSSPAIGADGTLYFGCDDSNLYAVYPDGSLKWKFLAGDRIYLSSPAIGGDGTVYIGSNDGNLYAIGPGEG